MRWLKPISALRSLCVSSLALLPGVSAKAQDEWDEAVLDEWDGVWDEAAQGINSLYEAMGDLLMVVLGAGALIVLVTIILRVMKGEKEAAEKLFWWLLGLAFGFVMIAVLQELKF